MNDKGYTVVDKRRKYDLDKTYVCKLPDWPVEVRGFAGRATYDECVAAANAYYAKDGNGAGGSLHVVLDDGNVETEHVRFCEEYAREREDWDGVILAQMLLTLTVEERERMYRDDL